MSNESPEYFLVMERRQREALALAIPGKSRQFEVLYALVKPKNKLSGKGNVQTAEAATAEQYCVQDANDQLVKPKKITRKGKTLRVDINDDHAFELLNFFERDASEGLSPQFVSHRKAGKGHFEVVDPTHDGTVDILPEEGPSWCAREDLVVAPAESLRYAADDLRAAAQPVYAAQTATQDVAGDVAVAGLLPAVPSWLLIAGGAGLALAGGSSGGGVSPSAVIDLVIQGRIMLGPVISATNDLQVVAYDATGKKLESTVVQTLTSTANGATIEYTMTIIGGYSGVVTVRLLNTGANKDYVSESAKSQIDLGNGMLYAVDTVAAGQKLKVINITQATDLAARQLLDASTTNNAAVGPKLATNTTASTVDTTNITVSKVLLNKSTSITQELPDTTVDTSGTTVTPTANPKYAEVLTNLDTVTQRFISPDGSNLGAIQTELAKKIIVQDGGNATVTATATPLFLVSLTTLVDGAVDDPSTPDINEAAVDDRTLAHVYTSKKSSGADVFQVQAMSLLDKVTNPNPITYAITGGDDQGYFSIDTATGQLKWNAAGALAAAPTVVGTAHPAYFEVQVTAQQDTGKKDSSGNPIYSTAQQTVLVHVDTTAPNADVNSIAGSVDASVTFSLASAMAGVSIASDAQAPTDTDIQKITVAIKGAGLNTALDKLVLETAAGRSLDANFAASNQTIGGVAGVDYSYDTKTGTLVLSKNTGTTFTPVSFDPATIDDLVKGILFKTTSTASGERTFTVSYTDAYGNKGTSATSTLTLDNTAPNADLNPDTTAGMANIGQTVNASQAPGGVFISPNTQTPADTDIAQVSLKFSGAGLDAANDLFVLGSATLSSLGTSVPATAITLGGVSVTYKYEATSKTLSITPTGGGVFTPKQVDDLVSAIQYKNAAPASTTQGDRVVTVSYTDAVGNTGTSATSTLTVDTRGPVADLNDDTTAGVVTTTQTVNASQASTGMALAPKTQTPTDTDIAQVNLVLGGAGLDIANDQFVLGGVTLSSLGTSVPATATTLGGVPVSYSYDATSKTLGITKTGGGVFTGKEVDDLVSAIQYKNAAPASTTQGDRVVTVSYTDAVGNTGTSASSTLKVDTLGPNADLNADNSSTPAVVDARTKVNASTASAGVAIAADAQPAADADIQTIHLKIGGAGLDLGKDRLVLGDPANPQALNADFSASSQTLGGVAGLDYTYKATTQTLDITRHDGQAFDPAKVDDVLAAVLFKNSQPGTTTQGDRTFAVSYTDLVGNTGNTATATLALDTLSPAISLAVSSVNTDGTTPAWADATNSADAFITQTEKTVVLKVDSVNPATHTALKVGDVITLQINGALSTNPAYQHTVTQDDVASGDGLDRAVYFKIDKADLLPNFAENKIQAHVVDGFGNPADSPEVVLLTVEAPVTITNDALDATKSVYDANKLLEVTSPIVLTASRQLASGASGKSITITNLDSGGAAHTFKIDAADTRYVKIVGEKIIVTPPFDFDFDAHYTVGVDAGAFNTLADAAKSIPSGTTEAVTGLKFQTVALTGLNETSAVQGYFMDTSASGTGALQVGKKWFAVDAPASATSVDASTGAYAMVFKDADVRGINPSINDGAATYFDVTVTGFGANDLIYADDQSNDATQMNDSRWTQIIDAGGASDLQADVRFDPVAAATPATGATFHLTLEASAPNALTKAQIIKHIRVTNANLATAISAIDRVDAAGTVIVSNKLDASITNAQPLHIKVSAALESGDTLQLRYIDGAGQEQDLGALHTVSNADATQQYAILDVSRTLLNQLPEQEGYNRIFAKLVSLKTGGVTYSRVLGGDSGVYLDTLPDTLVLSVKAGQDAVLTDNPADQVTLVVKAASLTLGSTLQLFDENNNQVGADHVIDASSLNADLELTTLTNSNLGFGAHTYTLKSTDAALNKATTTLVVTRNEYVAYNGTVGLGPVVAGNDLQVTAYKSDGTVLGTAAVAANGTFSVNVDKGYTGAITLSVANKGSSTATADYRDESTNTDLDIGTGMLSAIVYANGTAKTVHITPLTDLVARHLTDATPHQVGAGVTAAQINAYNLQLAKLFGVSSTQSITDVLPTFVLDTAGTLASATQLKNAYAQALAQISDQAVVKHATLANIQDQLANAITWSWDGTAATATLDPSGDLAKQVILLTKVAQAESLSTGSNGSSYLTLANLTDYGITGLGGLSLARTDNLIQRIVDAADDGSAFDTLTELQALANKVAALSKIQDYAMGITPQQPLLTDYLAAGLTGINSSNLFEINTQKILGSGSFAGSTPNPVVNAGKEALMQTAVNGWVTDALKKIASYADSILNAVPKLFDYAMAGISGVTADNLVKVNAAIDAIASGELASTPAVSAVQTYVDTAVSAYNQAVLKVRAYMRDTVPNPAPDATTFADLGLSNIDTANEVASANYYLGALMGAANADASQSLIRTNLTAQWKALDKINQYAIDNNNTAPVKADYIAAGVVWNTNSDQALFNATVDAKDRIDTAKALVDLLNTVASPSGTATLSSIVRAGSSVANGSFTSDAYLNAAELGAGQTAQFTVTFDRAVTGLAAGNFALSDAQGGAIAGAAPTLTLSSADANAGRLYTVTVGNLTGLSSKSLRLNLSNTTGVTDTQSNQSLSNTVYTGGQSYTVDTANPVTLAAAAGEDLTLSSSETSVNLYVDPANLSVGDVLKLTKADGNQVGSTVTVTSAHLSTGVTFNVLKSSLANGDNTLTVKSTDIAGNSGSASTTVTVLDYVQVTGILGLPSKVLAGNDLKVVAYDASNNVLGSGTIDATTNTYTLQLLKSTTGLVKLQLSSGIGNAKDFWDEATAAQADLGNMTFSAILNADGNAQTVHIGLLTDVAARLIAGISSPTAAQISAANLAVTQILLNSSATTGITAYTPDFGVGNSGTTTTSTASLYGQLLNQLSQQAQSKGRALDVVLEDLADGISYNSTTGVATLNNAFAKEVFLLAKVQMAAALSTATTVPASVLSAQDLIDYGVTGMSGANDPRMTDLLARIVATSDDGNAVDTLAELQALADKVVAIAKIQDYATANTNPAPTVADYVAAGYSTVTTDNLTAVNAKVDAVNATDITTDALLQTVVSNGVAAYTAAVAKIAAYANLNTNPAPTLADYVNAGVLNMTPFAVPAVNLQVDSAASSTDADTTAKIQNLVNAGIVINQDNIQAIQDYCSNPVTHDAPTLAQYQWANLAAITTAAQVANANALLSQTLQGQSLSDAALATRLSQQITALQTLSDYAQHGGTAPSTDTYTDAGIAGVTSTNLADVNARMYPGSALTTTAQILGVLKAVDLDSHTLGIASSSQTLVSDSNAHAVFADMALSYADGIQSIKVKVTGADTVNDQFIFGTVTKAINDNSLTGSGLTLNGVSGVSWAYSSSGKQLVFTRDDGNTFTAAQAQSIEQALQFKTAELTNQTERDFSLTHLYADGTTTTAVTAKFLVDTAPQVQTAAFDASTQTLQLGFDEALNIGMTPLITDFSHLQVGGASATLSSVSLNASADHLILALASSAFSDSVVTFHYAANTAAYRLTSAATGASVDSFTAVIDQASHNSTLVGSANQHNVIVGNGGADTLTGGSLSDLFIFGANTSGTSTITNFDFTQFDKLDLSGLLGHVTTGQEAQYLQLSNTAAGDLQIKIDKDGQGNFTSGLDATLVLTGNGHISANTGTELLNHFIKTNTFVL